MSLTKQELIKEFPALGKLTLDGTSDFNRVSGIIGSRNPKHVWPIVNILASQPKTQVSDKLARILAKLED